MLKSLRSANLARFLARLFQQASPSVLLSTNANLIRPPTTSRLMTTQCKEHYPPEDFSNTLSRLPEETVPSTPNCAQIHRTTSPIKSSPNHFSKRNGIRQQPHSAANIGSAGRRVVPSGAVRGGRVGKPFPPRKQPHTKGLKASNNTCYRVAMLQVLLHVPAFYHLLGTIHLDCEDLPISCVLCSLQAFTEGYWNDESLATFTSTRSSAGLPPRGPTRLSRRLNNALECCIVAAGEHHVDLAEDFTDSRQSDPYLFLRYLLSEIDRKEPDSFWETFGIEYDSSWTCVKCGYKHLKAEEEGEAGDVGLRVGISDPIPGLSLVEYLDMNHFDTTRTLICDRPGCQSSPSPTFGAQLRSQARANQGTPTAYQLTITKAPEILILKLERAVTARDSHGIWRERKNVQHVPYGEFMDLTCYTADGETLLYRLDGVVAHAGRSVRHGHYVAGVREAETAAGKRRAGFCVVNDDVALLRLRGGTVQELQRPYVHAVSDEAQAALLVYSKVCGKG